MTILLSPMVWIQSGKYMEAGDSDKGLLLIGVGLIMMVVGIIECNLKER